jgi:hypothetical protein
MSEHYSNIPWQQTYLDGMQVGRHVQRSARHLPHPCRRHPSGAQPLRVSAVVNQASCCSCNICYLLFRARGPEVVATYRVFHAADEEISGWGLRNERYLVTTPRIRESSNGALYLRNQAWLALLSAQCGESSSTTAQTPRLPADSAASGSRPAHSSHVGLQQPPTVLSMQSSLCAFAGGDAAEPVRITTPSDFGDTDVNCTERPAAANACRHVVRTLGSTTRRDIRQTKRNRRVQGFTGIDAGHSQKSWTKERSGRPVRYALCCTLLTSSCCATLSCSYCMPKAVKPRVVSGFRIIPISPVSIGLDRV